MLNNTLTVRSILFILMGEQMKYQIRYDHSHNFFLIETEGDFCQKTFELLKKDLFANPNWQPGTDAIYDYRKTNFYKVSDEDFQRIEDSNEQQKKQLGNGKAALVMGDITNFGMGRLYENKHGNSIDIHFCVFTDFNKAYDWIVG